MVLQNRDSSSQGLEKILKRFQQANLNGDGTLTKQEALEAMRCFRGRQQKPDLALSPTYENIKYGKYNRNVLELWLPESSDLTATITIQDTCF